MIIVSHSWTIEINSNEFGTKTIKLDIVKTVYKQQTPVFCKYAENISTTDYSFSPPQLWILFKLNFSIGILVHVTLKGNKYFWLLYIYETISLKVLETRK